MAGIGVRLNRIYNKNTIISSVAGFGYSTVITVAPMFLVIGAILLMQVLNGYSSLGYYSRELYACTILYIFVFGLLSASPFNAVLSKYMSDVIYEERYDCIMSCFYTGLVMNLIFSSLLAIPFCAWELLVGKVAITYIFTGYCGYLALVMVFYSMLYISICKEYGKISLFFAIGMGFSVLFSLLLHWVFRIETTYSMLISLDLGLLLTAALEYALIRSYFRENSGNYREVLGYFKTHRYLVATNFMYTLGLYIHNFVFWASDMHLVVADTFVCMTSYDMATCIAMLTNISASIILISRMEMNFHERYRCYSEAVIGGRGMDIENAKRRMFDQLKTEIMNLVRIQFIVTVIVYLFCVVLMPQFGFGGLVLQIYPCLAVGYFILFLMYALIIFLYYFNDSSGAVLTAVCFCVSTLLGTIVSSSFKSIWWGAGLIAGAFIGWTVGYFRLRYTEKNLDIHIFCRGAILEHAVGRMPSNLVYDRNANGKKRRRKKTDWSAIEKMAKEAENTETKQAPDSLSLKEFLKAGNALEKQDDTQKQDAFKMPEFPKAISDDQKYESMSSKK